LVLGNVLTAMANTFNPPLPTQPDIATVNARLQQLLSDLDAQIPGIAPAPLPPSGSDPGSVLGVTVPGLNLDLLGMGIKTSAIVTGAAVHTGAGDLLGNIYTAVLNTMSATPAEVGSVSANVGALLAKVVGVFNASTISLPAGVVASLPPAYQTLADPTLINPAKGATASIFDLAIASASGATPPTAAGSLGLNGRFGGIGVGLTARTGDGLLLGNVLYNVANLLNPGASSPNYLYLLQLLA
jgi:hypothetical protein